MPFLTNCINPYAIDIYNIPGIYIAFQILIPFRFNLSFCFILLSTDDYVSSFISKIFSTEDSYSYDIFFGKGFNIVIVINPHKL